MSIGASIIVIISYLVKLKRWREVLKKNGLEISIAKTEVLKFKFNNKVGRNGSDYSIRLINEIKTFKYSVSIVQENGEEKLWTM